MLCTANFTHHDSVGSESKPIAYRSPEFELSKYITYRIWACTPKASRMALKKKKKVPPTSRHWICKLKFLHHGQHLELFLSFQKNQVSKFELQRKNLSFTKNDRRENWCTAKFTPINFNGRMFGPWQEFRAFFELSKKPSIQIWASTEIFERHEKTIPAKIGVPLASRHRFSNLKFFDEIHNLELFLSFQKNKVSKFELQN